MKYTNVKIKVIVYLKNGKFHHFLTIMPFQTHKTFVTFHNTNEDMFNILSQGSRLIFVSSSTGATKFYRWWHQHHSVSWKCTFYSSFS